MLTECFFFMKNKILTRNGQKFIFSFYYLNHKDMKIKFIVISVENPMQDPNQNVSTKLIGSNNHCDLTQTEIVILARI